jgi:hypothetical protein
MFGLRYSRLTKLFPRSYARHVPPRREWKNGETEPTISGRGLKEWIGTEWFFVDTRLVDAADDVHVLAATT